MDNIQLNKTFTFNIKDISFGDLSTEVLNEILTDGRLVSHFLERQLEIWFPELTFVDGKGHDHIDTDGKLYDQKCFTHGGLAFAPSNMIGKGRHIVEDVATEHCKKIIYICCDVIDFPTVNVRFVKGTDLLKEFPAFKIKNRKTIPDRENFFEL